jgi:hypothetical protein
MIPEHRAGRDPDLAEAVAALRADRSVVVPQRVEDELVAAFRVQRAAAALRDDEAVVVPPELESRLVAAFRRHQVPGIAADPSTRGGQWHLVRAAVVVAGLGGVLWLGVTALRNAGDPSGSSAVAVQSPSAPSPPPAPRRDRAQASRSPARVPVRQEPANQPLSGGALAGVSRVPAVARGVESSHEVTIDVEDAGFVPLSYGVALPGEPAHVVRVEVPRSALFDFGAQADVVPGEADAVPADVLLSEDGMPRGIRFVDRFSTPPLAGPATPGRIPVPDRRR